MQIGIIEQLTSSAVRIECKSDRGQASSGSGFFFGFGKDDKTIPLIVTNKHVISGARTGQLVFTLTKADGSGNPDTGNLFRLTIGNFESRWIPHPDPDIDLAVMPIAGALEEVHRVSGRHAFFIQLGTNIIATSEERASYSTMEDVLMIGYPNGIWDEVNNKPVIRRGITASHIGTRWNGKDEFLIDIATYPGSSGSPVFLINLGSFTNAMGQTYMGQHRIKLLGINHSVMLHTADGEIKMIDTPTAMTPIPRTGVPNNLGVAVNSLRLLDFEAILEQKILEIKEPREQAPASAPAPMYPRKIF